MIGLALALGVAVAPEANDLATRLRASATAAQALQGPLDGSWTLAAGGRARYAFQITDIAGGARPLEGAWRRAGAAAAPRSIDIIARQGDRLSIRLIDEGEVVRIRLHRRAEGQWSGELNDNGVVVPAELLRPAASPSLR
jgi:hypothetical protein